MIAFGRFRMIDLGDLTWNKEQELVCPNNLLGTVDVYLTTHHGLAQSDAPVIVHALQPRVAIMNNGPTKGGAPEAMQTITARRASKTSGSSTTRSRPPADATSPQPMIANLDESAAHYIKVSRAARRQLHRHQRAHEARRRRYKARGR